MSDIRAPYDDPAAVERPDLAERLGPTVGRAMTLPFDNGRRVGLAVTFNHSGRRFGVIGDTLEAAVAVVQACIAEAPYGSNRRGEPWEKRS